ncbi:MAG: hypothetical protein ACXVGB_03685 [Mycobacteriaceae bacterium]
MAVIGRGDDIRKRQDHIGERALHLDAPRRAGTHWGDGLVFNGMGAVWCYDSHSTRSAAKPEGPVRPARPAA